MSRPLTLLALLAVALCCLATLLRRHRRRAAARRRQRFLDQASRRRAAAADLMGAAPAPSADGATQSPLAPFLAKALDRALPPPEGALQAVAWTHDELRDLASRVVQRVNNRSPELGLSLVAFDRVSKTVDEATGILRYQFDAQVHAVRRDTSARVTVKVDVDGDREYVRDIAVHGARLDVSAVRGTGGAADGHVEYARYEPVVRYDPQPV